MRTSLLLALAALSACQANAPAPTTVDAGPRVAINVAPLSLTEVTDARFTLTVTNGPNGTGTTVWSREVTSSQYGDGAGGLSYVGPCDPTNGGINTVTVTIEDLYDGPNPIAANSWQNPTPVSLEAPCSPNSDTPVTFNLTVVRSANQGFFDVAVEFQDIFCSAKLDCLSEDNTDLNLLHRPNGGDRDLTAVLAVACTGSPTGSTYLYMDDLLIDCEGQFPVFGRVRPTGQGNITPLANPGNYLYGAAVYRGVEELANKAYWNVALGLDETTFAANGECSLIARATASRLPFSQTDPGFAVPSGVIYPVIDWVVPLSNETGRVCGRHAVNESTLVKTTYRSDLPLFPDSGTTHLQHRYERATGEVRSAVIQKCIVRAEVCNNVDDDCDGTIDDGVLSPCGDCDPTCQIQSIGGGGDPEDPDYVPPPNGGFDPTDMVGTTWDPVAGGIVIDRVAITSNYLWIPNTAESTLSKWDASTNTELATYRVGLVGGECAGQCCWSTGCNQPSRVVVDARGDAYVANRGFGMQGTVTKVAGDLERCIDRNSNGTIETSVAGSPLAWGADECILWTAPVGAIDAVLRAVGIDRGDASNPEGYPWVGSYNNSQVYKLNPDTGAVIATVNVPVRPYGMVVTADGTLWVSSLDSGGMAAVNTTTNQSSAIISYPAGRSCSDGGTAYGITADGSGRIWLSGWSCRDAIVYDPALGQWSIIKPAGWTEYAGRGITVRRVTDAQNQTVEQIWMAIGGDGQSRVAWWNSSIFAAGQTVTTGTSLYTLPVGNTGPSGVGADSLGNIWVAHHNAPSNLVKLLPATSPLSAAPTLLGTYTGANRVYTYSDFTGAVRRLSVDQGSYVHEVTATCQFPLWETFEWQGSAPAGSTVTFSVRTAESLLDLNSATIVPVPVGPDVEANLAALFVAAGVQPRAALAITLSMSQGTSPTSPVVQGFSLGWRCPN